MGRYALKETTSAYRQLDVRRLQRDGLLEPGRCFPWQWLRDGQVVASIQVRTEHGRVILSYRHRRKDNEWKAEEYPVFLERMTCNYGGTRPWFQCPARGCGRRVAILYGGAIFACRHCYHLAHASQRESASSRALSRAQSIRIKLGGSANLAERFPRKPKGMHWRTYRRLHLEEAEANAQSWPPWLMREISHVSRSSANSHG
jgi:hypothetical protein